MMSLGSVILWQAIAAIVSIGLSAGGACSMYSGVPTSASSGVTTPN